MKNLSKNAQTLYKALNKTGGMWIGNGIPVLFGNAPEYPLDRNPDKQRVYWQWDANINGMRQERPVGNEFETFFPSDNYSAKVSEAYQELRREGLAGEKNNGFNEYWIFAK